MCHIGRQVYPACAIQEANKLAEGVPADTYTIELNGSKTYSLTLPGADEDAAATGDLDIRANVTINGHGATVEGLSKVRDRVFQVFSGWDVAINDLTITEGYSNNENGGGILNDDFGTSQQQQGVKAAQTAGQLTLTNVVLNDNGAGAPQQGEDNGGGVYNGTGRMLEVHGSTFSNNTAGNGGGLYNAGTAEIHDSTFSGNVSTCSIFECLTYGLGGGGIANIATLTLDGSKLLGNGAFIGGGLSNADITLALTPPQSGPPQSSPQPRSRIPKSATIPGSLVAVGSLTPSTRTLLSQRISALRCWMSRAVASQAIPAQAPAGPAPLVATSVALAVG